MDTLLSAAKNKVENEEADYRNFLQEADVASRVLNSNRNIAVNITGTLTPVGGANSHSNSGNRSLELIFYFYARLQGSAQQLGVDAPTFEQIQWASNTLSFMELVMFCRDFSIIPTLLSKDELRFVWRVTAPQWEGNERFGHWFIFIF